MSDIKVRVGQQNSIKVISSIAGERAFNDAVNVIGGIASVTQLNVSGISTFVGIATFKNDLFVDGNLTVVGIASFKNDVFINGDLTASVIDGGTY